MLAYIVTHTTNLTRINGAFPDHFRKFVRLGLGKKEVALSMYLSVNVKLEPSQLSEGRYHISSPRGPYKQIEGR